MLVDDINANLDEMDALYQQGPGGATKPISPPYRAGYSAGGGDHRPAAGSQQGRFSRPGGAALYRQDVPTALEASHLPAFFMVPPIDSQDKNTIYINNSMLDPTTLFTTLAHEGCPATCTRPLYTYLLDLDPLQ